MNFNIFTRGRRIRQEILRLLDEGGEYPAVQLRKDVQTKFWLTLAGFYYHMSRLEKEGFVGREQREYAWPNMDNLVANGNPRVKYYSYRRLK